MEKNYKKILVIIPAFNEEENIETTIKTLKAENKSWDLLVINDCSRDNTSEIVKKMENVKIINLVDNLGIGGAVQTGFKYAVLKNYDVVIQFDGDGQHIAREINKIIEPIKNKEANIVIGSRFLFESKTASTTFTRKLGIKLLSYIIYFFQRIKISDVTSGFRAYDNSSVRFLSNNYPADYPEPESLIILLKMGFKIKEMFVEMNPRKKGKSSIYGIYKIYYMVKVIIAILMAHFRNKKSYNHGS